VSTALVDDRLLAAVLRGERVRVLRGHDLATTGCWYVRLCGAVMSAAGRTGTLSGPFRNLPEPERTAALTAVTQLPPTIELVSLRELAPTIGILRQRHDLNLLSIEALASAVTLGATVFLTADTPRLQQALKAEGCGWHRVDPAG